MKISPVYLNKTSNLIQSNLTKEEIDNAWVVVKKGIGQFGKKRNEIYRALDKEYGYLTWHLAWQIGEEKYLPFNEAIKYYEKAYEEFLKNNPQIVEYLIKNAKDVYDNSETNVSSGTDYAKQETKSHHYQDIAIRCVLTKLGKNFQGDKLIQIRSKSHDEVGKMLSPGRVPFHRPELITNSLQSWWKEKSIEDFWQSNKVIQFNPLLASLRPQYRKIFFNQVS